MEQDLQEKNKLIWLILQPIVSCVLKPYTRKVLIRLMKIQPLSIN